MKNNEEVVEGGVIVEEQVDRDQPSEGE